MSAGKLSPARAMFAWSQEAEDQQQQQQADALQQQSKQPQQLQRMQEPQQPQQQQQPVMLRTGAVVMSLQGPVLMELLVAQGCRPLSTNIYTIDKTASHSSVVLKLRDASGRAVTPVEALQKELHKVGEHQAVAGTAASLCQYVYLAGMLLCNLHTKCIAQLSTSMWSSC